MNCQVCGAPSGKYPICKECNEKKKQGFVVKCENCGRWHSVSVACGCQNGDRTIPEEIKETVPEIETAAAAVSAAAVSAAQVISDGAPYAYDKKSALLTRNEQGYFDALRAQVPDGYHVFPQINLATFITKTVDHRYQNELFRNVDFLVTDGKYEPCFAVEINDKSHTERNRRERDEKVKNILEEAGVPLVTLWTDYGVNEGYIKKRVDEALTTPVTRRHHFDSEKSATDSQTDYAPLPHVTYTPSSSGTNGSKTKKQGCYVATCVYGSYDCPQVWTLRRYRDISLASNPLGRAFIRLYYAVSPMLVRLFGGAEWFRSLWKPFLDRKVARLNAAGFADTPYTDHP